MVSTDPFRVWIPIATSDHPLVRQSECHQGYVFSLGSGPVTWACKKQQAISLSSVEAEYRVVINASEESLCLR